MCERYSLEDTGVEAWKFKPKIDFGYVLDFLTAITWGGNVPGHYNKIGLQVCHS
jgi:hypothetical protein